MTQFTQNLEDQN